MAFKRLSTAPDNSVTVRLRNVRLSFPALFQPRSFEEGKPPSFSAAFLLEKEANDSNDNLKLLKQALKHIIDTTFKGKHPGKERICVRSGADKGERGVDGYHEDMFYVSSGSRKAIPIVDRDTSTLQETSNKPYAGCYVNATIRLWAQDHKQYGRRINAQLRLVQFWTDGDPFGESAVDPDEELADVAGEAGGPGESSSSVDDML